MVTFKEIRKFFPAKLSKKDAEELNTIRQEMNSLKTEDEKKAYFEEFKLKYAQSPTTESTKKETNTPSQKPKTLSSFAELGQFHDELAKQPHSSTAEKKDVQPKKNKTTKTKSKYSKKDLKKFYSSQEALDSAWEYLQHQPNIEKEKFIAEREEKIRIQKELTQIALPHSPNGKLSREIHTQIVNISFLPPEKREKAVKKFLQIYQNNEDKTMTKESTKNPFDKEFEKWKQNNPTIPLDEEKAKKYFDTYGNLENFMKDPSENPEISKETQGKTEKPREEAKPASPQEEPTIAVRFNDGATKPEGQEGQPNTTVRFSDGVQEQQDKENGLAGIEKLWRTWCDERDENKNLLRNFENTSKKEDDGSLQFKITPTDALKAQKEKKGLEAKSAEVTYYDENNVTMPMTDYDYFAKAVEIAKQIPGATVIECGDIQTRGYATRLIAAAYANGLEVEKAPKPNEIDLSNETLKGIPEEAILMVLDKQFFNRDANTAEKIDYESIKEALRVYTDILYKDTKENSTSEPKKLDISKILHEPIDKAVRDKVIAAALEMKLRVNNNGTPVEFNKEEIEKTEGIPKEALEKAAQQYERQNKRDSIGQKTGKNAQAREKIGKEEETAQKPETQNPERAKGQSSPQSVPFPSITQGRDSYE